MSKITKTQVMSTMTQKILCNRNISSAINRLRIEYTSRFLLNIDPPSNNDHHDFLRRKLLPVRIKPT